MKGIIMSCCVFFTALSAYAQFTVSKDSSFKDSFYLLSPVEVRAVRAGADAPFARTNIGRPELVKLNLGQDIPYLLDQTPGVVVNSDAGNGIGYTGIRIRGTDATRINITLNGIPYNDAESQGSFFVDLPDISSSAGSVQVQRGVGTSSNGAGAFGASINFSTNEVNKQAFAELNNSYGSFNSWKNTIRIGTGLHHGFTSEFRLSNISSDGYIDRASSRLRSFYFTTAWISEKNAIRLNLFSGHEKTYQAWYGISQSDLDAGNRRVNYAGTERAGQPYENETDNYTQSHAQMFYNHRFNSNWNFNTAFFLTKGKGYYEQYKADQEYASYGLANPIIGQDTIYQSDFVRQLWLENYYYGNIFALQYASGPNQASIGGSVTRYDGNHYGKLVWASRVLNGKPRWYDLDALKTDATIYVKEQRKIGKRLSYYLDLQYRHVNYEINGFRYNPGLLVNNQYNFFNPKMGITYIHQGWKAFASYAIANKEPNRDDFEANQNQQPRAEKLQDLEISIGKTGSRYNWAITGYYMKYKDQLVLTGKINDVGAYTRENIPVSFRQGIELEGGYKFNHWLNASANIAVSANKVKNFTEYIDDYDNGGQKSHFYSRTDIAYSPAVVSAAKINFIPVRPVELSLQSKYVSDQYLDNTSNEQRRLDAFFVQDLSGSYSFRCKKIKEAVLILKLNNIWSRDYEPNGYTYSYYYAGVTTTENYYFPMAGRNLLIALNLKF
ncbi:MAG: TonB-dependent receptor plug domain-containing protein [Chitinophagaceae bacterium]|nr:TonB-dependent receptor plug domain-containing protein [Chitinophagaceae bacterium]